MPQNVDQVLVPAAPPAPAPAQATTVGQTPAQVSDPAAVLRGFRAQRDELTDQLRSLKEERQEIGQEIQQARNQGMDVTGLQARLVETDKQMISVQQQLAVANQEVARATATPGAVEPEVHVHHENGGGGGRDEFGAGFAVAWAVVLPIWLFRRWRRSRRVVAAKPLPAEATDRLRTIEQTVEAIAVEMERIGEGQRFMSRLFTERGGVSALGEGAAQPVGVPARERAPQTPSR